MFGGTEILIILAIVVLLFGAKKIPELAKGMGTGIKEFKKASREEQAGGEIEHKDGQASRASSDQDAGAR
jgi:sec-independent protein translocase protein TatA